jgi:aspartyl aminopeptidase
MDQKYVESTLELIDFINDSPSCYHVVANLAAILENAGCIKLEEGSRFKLQPGYSYYVTRNSSALIAFRIPASDSESSVEPAGFSIVAAHTDSPSFKVKANPELPLGEAYTTINVEGYGGMLMAPWFDRPLSLAGRAFIRTTDGLIVEKLVDFDKDLCQIVNLCIHQNREANKGYEYKIQKDMLPILACGNKVGAIKSLVAELLEVDEEAVVDTELFLYNRMRGSIWGLEDEFYSVPKIDDLQCAYTAIKAFVNAQNSKSSRLQMVALFDNEEVGSGTKQGADSDFLTQTISRIGGALGWDYESQCIAKAKSFMVSADNGHSIHPNYPEKCDPSNKPVMNKGLMIKYAGNQKYTTDAYSGAYLKNILEEAQLPYQLFFNNSNVPGGGTLGNISGSQFSIPSVDVGAAQLAMHSPYETGGTQDTYNLTESFKAFFEN